MKVEVFHSRRIANANKDKQCAPAVEAPHQSHCIFAKNSLLP